MIDGFKSSGIVSCAASFIPVLAFEAAYSRERDRTDYNLAA